MTIELADVSLSTHSRVVTVAVCVQLRRDHRRGVLIDFSAEIGVIAMESC